MKFRNNPDLAVLILRAAVGAVGVFHGCQKLFWMFGGSGPRSFGDHLASLGIPLPVVAAYLAGLSELLGGLLVGIGLFTRPAAVPFAFTMAVAIWSHGWKFDAGKGGFEYPMTLLAALVAIFLLGPGRFSVDHIFRSKGTE
jgi:putative oxidoreductase